VVDSALTVEQIATDQTVSLELLITNFANCCTYMSTGYISSTHFTLQLHSNMHLLCSICTLCSVRFYALQFISSSRVLLLLCTSYLSNAVEETHFTVLLEKNTGN